MILRGAIPSPAATRRAGRALLLAAAALTAPLASSAAAADDPVYAMTQSDHRPCTTPCSQLDVVYRKAASKLNVPAGVQTLAMDFYRSPKTPKKDAPVVLLLHGGGFVEGDRTQMRRFGETLSKSGFLVASVEYRLVDIARNAPLPIAKQDEILPAAQEATEDTQAALRYIRAHAKALGATTDKARYAVGGYSAGAITALRVALRGGDKSTPASRRWKVGAAFAIAGFECSAYTKPSGCSGAWDAKDPPIDMFLGDADTIIQLPWAMATCTGAILKGGGCNGYVYPGQDHAWTDGSIFGGGPGLNKKHPAVVPTVAKFLRKELAAKR